MLSFHVKFVQTERRMDNGKTICPPIFRYGGIKILVTMQASFTGYGMVKGYELYLLNPCANKPWLLPVCDRSLLKTLGEKEKSLVMSNFSFSLSIFTRFSATLIKSEIVDCKSFQFGRV